MWHAIKMNKHLLPYILHDGSKVSDLIEVLDTEANIARCEIIILANG